MDRVILGKHANTLLNEVGLYVSKPGANVLDPQTYLDGNLMFSSTDASSLNIIQSGAFKITCEREPVALSGTTPSVGTHNLERIFQISLKDIFGSGGNHCPCPPAIEGFAHTTATAAGRRKDRFIWATHYRAVGTPEQKQAAVDFGLAQSPPITIPYDTWADNRDDAQRALRDATGLWSFYMDVAGAESNLPINYNNPHYPGAGHCKTVFSETRHDYGGAGNPTSIPSGYISTSPVYDSEWIWDGDVAYNPINGSFVGAGPWGDSRLDEGTQEFSNYEAGGSWAQQTDLVVRSCVVTDGAHGGDPVQPDPALMGGVPSDLKVGAMLRMPESSWGFGSESLPFSTDPFDQRYGEWGDWDHPNTNFARAADFWMAVIPYVQVPYTDIWGDPNHPLSGYYGPDWQVTDPNWSPVVTMTPQMWMLNPAMPGSAAIHELNEEYKEFGATVTTVTNLGIGIDEHFYHDSERPTNLSAMTWGGWYSSKEDVMEGNYIDRGNVTIPIINPLPDGEIPEVAIRFAVGSSGKDGKQVRFHPWYANVATTPTSDWAPDWDDFTYTNEDEIVHMDSPWVRFKWGGIGSNLYSGVSLHENAREAWEAIWTPEELDALESLGVALPGVNPVGTPKSRKLWESALGHSVGVSGLFHFSNSTHLSVEAHMTPTHTGLRRPVVFSPLDHAAWDSRRNALEDYAAIKRKTPSAGDGYTGWPRSYTNLEYLPATTHDRFGSGAIGGIGTAAPQLNGTDSLYGWLGHPLQYFSNPFSNTMCTFYTHMQPPFIDQYDPATYPLHYHGRQWALEIDQVNLGETYHTDSLGVSHRIPVWGPDIPGISSQADSDEWWVLGGFLSEGEGIQWPPGHEFGNWSDDVAWQGSMGMGGAGPARTLGLSEGDSNCWDTYYCSYVIYSHGRKPDVSAQQSNTITVSARSSTLAGGNMINPLKYRGDADDDDMRYFNLNFPDDFVGTPGDPATDPFHNHRDESGRIYGSLNIIFEIPEYDTPGVDPMYIGSEEFEQFFMKTGSGLSDFKLMGKPKPAITFDLSGRNFNFINNQNLNLIIKNHGIVLGGGGAGGYGGHYNYDLNPGETVPGGKTSAGDAPLKIGGGGGGAGGGSGRGNNPAGTLHDSNYSYAGTGKAGSGYGRAILIGGSLDETWSAEMQGETGTDITLHTSANPSYRNVSGGAGGLAGTVETINRVDSLQPDYGSDGGDCFFIIHDETYLPNIEIINIGSGSNSTQVNDAMMRSGGGGAGGGAGGEIVNEDRPSGKVFGATGAEAGYNGNPDTSTSGENSRYQWPGGAAGYLVGAYADSLFDVFDGEYNVGWPEVPPGAVTTYPENTEEGIYDKVRAAYAGKITVRNEASTETIYARHPNGATTPGTAGWSLGVGSSEYKK